MKSDLHLGNQALLEKKYAQALEYYHSALARQPQLFKIIKPNILLAEKKLNYPFAETTKQQENFQTKETIDIVVPVYNALDDVKLCLESLARHTDEFKVRVLVVNDGSDESTTLWLREFCLKDRLFYLIEHPANKGYTCTVNTGLRVSTAGYVVTQNSDTIVSSGWLKGMVGCMKSDPQIGVVGPLSNAATWQNVPFLRDQSGGFAVNDLPKGHTIESMSRLVASVSTRQYPRLPFINGFCFMIRRSVIDSVGYMDEENFPVGYGEENDYCIRATDAGFELAIADDVYVFHAKSKSFGHERRKILSQQGTESIKRKHTPEKYAERVSLIKKTEILDSVRANISNQLDRLKEPNKIDLMTMRILFLLPVKGGGGGAHSIVQEVTEMRRLGLNARVGVKHEQIDGFVKAYADIEGSSETFIEFDDNTLIEVAESYDIVVGTIFASMKLVKRIADVNPHILPAYYVQDYEPMFFPEGTAKWQEARESYTLVSGAFLFAKTQWIIDEVNREHGVAVHKVQPSIDHEVYKPVQRGTSGRLVVSAMIRPQTPRRGAERTMRLLAGLYKQHGDRIAIHLFGCKSDHPDFLKLERGFPFANHGTLLRPQVAELLAQSDLFIDLSDYQAFGRTALEAMACGCTAAVPTAGGAHEYAIHQENALVLDTLDEPACFAAISGLLEKPDALQRMSRKGLVTAARYSVHAAAMSEVVPLETALKAWLTTRPRREKPVLYLLPSLRGDGLPTNAGYVRVVLPYQSTAVLREWRVHQTNELPQPGSGQLALIQREAIGHSLDALKQWLPGWKAAGGKLLYEIDDDLLDADGLRARQHAGDVESTAAKVRFLARNADVVHVSTEPLAARLKPFNQQVRVIPNALDAGLWRLATPRQHDQGPFRRQSDGPVRIGYIGTPTHDEDLDLVTEAMRAIEAKYGAAVEIEVIGGFQKRAPTFGKRVGLPKKNDYLHFVRWLHERVHWDIGIIPLAETPFNASISYLKFLEYAALDMAIVVSAGITYDAVARPNENCFIPQTANTDWINAISTLIDNKETRALYAATARKEVHRSHTLDQAGQLIVQSMTLMQKNGAQHAI
jgi:GT2 family glycosyltransferase/glycosyltransferase involved in cell wall biosynthesis